MVVVASTPGDAGGELVWTSWELGGGGAPFSRLPINQFHATDVAPAVSFRNTEGGSSMWLGVVDAGDGSIFGMLLSLDGSPESSWVKIPGLQTRAAMAVNTQPSVSTMVALAQPPDDRLRYTTYLNDQPPADPPGDYWRDVTPYALTAFAPAAAAVDEGNYLFIAVTAIDLSEPNGRLMLNQGTLDAQSFVGYQPLGFASNIAPAMASAGNRTIVAAADPNGVISYTWWDLGSAGQGWTQLGSDITTDTAPAVVLVDNGDYMFVVARGQDGDLHINQGGVTNASIVGWQPMH